MAITITCSNVISSSPAQGDLAVSATTTKISPNGLEPPPPPPQPAISGLPNTFTNPIASTIASHTSSWASFSSSSRSMVKTLGYYGAAPVELIEDNVKRDENGMEVMEVDFQGEGEDGDEEEESVGDEDERDVGDSGEEMERGRTGCTHEARQRRAQARGWWGIWDA